jgi:5-methylcytosine-specific restriction protein A
VNYVTQRTTPVTVDEISPIQYKKIFARCAKKHSHDEAEESNGLLPEEFLEREIYIEGLRKQIQVSRYERNRQARKKCLEHYGASCQICGFDFKKKYRGIEKGIHIHHRKPLSEIGENYEVDPIRDLLPVCPNCHTIIHGRNPAYTIEEICALLTRSNRSENG